MGTIEPNELLRLLNDEQSAQPPELPSIHSLSLPPFEGDTSSHRRGNAGAQQIPSLGSMDLSSRHTARLDGIYRSETASTSSTNGNPLHLHPESLTLRPLHTSNPTDPSEEAAPKKRQRSLTVHQDFGGQLLPNPLKKRRSTQQVVPPIISGLLEPPQDAAVLPPMVGGYATDASILNPLNEYVMVEVDRPPAPTTEPDRPDKPEKTNRGRTKRRLGKQRRKWTQDETDNLLLGVHKYGVGKWTNILEDPEYSFNDRIAGDLKDRFRTICPPTVRDQLAVKDSGSEMQRASPYRPKKSIPLENILNENILITEEEPHEKRKGPSSITSVNHDSDSAGPRKAKGRAHRKNIEDLEVLGIRAPFKKSERRERRPFTDQDDKEILEGLHQYGPAWTKIQRDTRFHLASRQPTDLRDRVRNKYPDIYNSIEKGSFHSIQHGRGTTKILEPSVNMSVGNLLPTSVSSHSNRTSSKENLSRSTFPSSGPTDSFESLPGIASFDMGDPSAPTFMTSGEEMAISRLMIRDPQATVDYGAGLLDDRSGVAHGGASSEGQSTRSGHPEPPKSPGAAANPPVRR